MLTSNHISKCSIQNRFQHFQGWGFHHLLESLFQCHLSVKKLFPISKLNILLHNLRPFLLVLSHISWRKGWPQPPFWELWRAIRSPLSLLFSRLNNPSSFNCSSSDLCSRPFTSFVALLMTHSFLISRDTLFLLFLNSGQNPWAVKMCS